MVRWHGLVGGDLVGWRAVAERSAAELVAVVKDAKRDAKPMPSSHTEP